MKCPHCGLFNPPEALRCDCGYDFEAGVVLESYLRERKGGVGRLDGVAPHVLKLSPALALVTSAFAYLAAGALDSGGATGTGGLGGVAVLLALASVSVVLVVVGLIFLLIKNKRGVAPLLLSAGVGGCVGLWLRIA